MISPASRDALQGWLDAQKALKGAELHNAKVRADFSLENSLPMFSTRILEKNML